jgi:hypothetical protein
VKKPNYIFVRKNHRNQDPSSKEYEFSEDYINKMVEENGLVISYLNPFKVPRDYTCFEVVDEGKAFRFVMLNSEFVQRPSEFFNLE